MIIEEPEPYKIRFLSSIKEIDQIVWNHLASNDYPFLLYEFLLALEESQCASSQSGWQPHHAIVEIETDSKIEVIAVMPLYLKTNSMGEYVFDWSWADAYEQHGVQYYPKFVTSIPFTPSTGTRICINPDFDQTGIINFLTEHILLEAGKLNVSSWHILFPEKKLSENLDQQGIQLRLGCQYQWHNQGFESFENFLEKFSSRKRKNIKKERQKILASAIEFELIEGADILSEHWQKFYLFYQSTYFVRGRPPYLNLDFFLQIGTSMPENLLLVMALKDGEYIAGALSFKGNDTLYGRYWGCSEEYQFLHFETCYYQGIEYCIKHGLKRFDSGAQGEHKIQRGFEPILTYSNHWIQHPQFNQAIARFLEEEHDHIKDYILRASEALPFKKEL